MKISDQLIVNFCKVKYAVC